MTNSRAVELTSFLRNIFEYELPSVRGRWGNNLQLKGNPSDLDDRRRLISPSDQREDNVTSTGTTDRCASASSLPVPVMAAPTVLEKSLSNKGLYYVRFSVE